MALMKEIRRRLPNAAGQVLGCLVVGYFAYHLVEGDRGLLAMRYLNQEIAQARLTLAAIESEHQALDGRVALLRPTGLDPDMLDERARIMLNLAGPDEVVIPLDRPFQPPPPRGFERAVPLGAQPPRAAPAAIN